MTIKNLHTPGPWKVGAAGCYTIDSDGYNTTAEDVCILTLDDHEVLGCSEWLRVADPDLQLMVAAPELLKACQLLLEGCDEYWSTLDEGQLAISLARQAIKKALE